MSSLIWKGVVLDTGVITEETEGWLGTKFTSKEAFKGAYIIEEEPPSGGNWRFFQNTFIDIDQEQQEENERNEIETKERLKHENSFLLNDKKVTLRTQFGEAYLEPVTLPDGSVWNGGMNSALSIDGAVRMAENAGLTSITLYDNSNDEHVVDIATGKNIAAAIGAAYQTKFALKQTLFKQLDSIDLEIAEARSQIEAITYA